MALKVYAKKYQGILWLLVFGYFFMLMARITLHYFPVNHSTAFLNIKQTEVRQVALYFPIFYIHVISTVFVLLAGFTQFSNTLLCHYPGVHRTIGKIYVAILLCFAAPSGFFIGCYANGGLASKISFILLSLLWFYFTLKGFTAIRKKKITEHQAFMLRSFALTFSAVTLRFWKVILVYLFQPSPMDVYQIIAWLGWIPNILIVEYYLYRNSKP